jgi:hypothetical protein
MLSNNRNKNQEQPESTQSIIKWQLNNEKMPESWEAGRPEGWKA